MGFITGKQWITDGLRGLNTQRTWKLLDGSGNGKIRKSQVRKQSEKYRGNAKPGAFYLLMRASTVVN